jgi:hypothetical protein
LGNSVLVPGEIVHTGKGPLGIVKVEQGCGQFPCLTTRSAVRVRGFLPAQIEQRRSQHSSRTAKRQGGSLHVKPFGNVAPASSIVGLDSSRAL